jgi:hypothetical protein
LIRLLDMLELIPLSRAYLGQFSGSGYVNKCRGLEFSGRQFAVQLEDFRFVDIAWRANLARLGIGQECVGMFRAKFAEVGNESETPILC